jgi:hypothetical protein
VRARRSAELVRVSVVYDGNPNKFPVIDGSAASVGSALMTTADDIPVAHTPPGGYGSSFPPLVLAGCTEPLVAGAPDLRGIWRTVSATRGGEPVPADDHRTDRAVR